METLFTDEEESVLKVELEPGFIGPKRERRHIPVGAFYGETFCIGLAAAAPNMVFTPLDLAKVRMQANPYFYSSIASTWKSKTRIKLFFLFQGGRIFRGAMAYTLQASLTAATRFTSFTFITYELQCRGYAYDTPQKLGSAIAASVLGILVASPLEQIKVALQRSRKPITLRQAVTHIVEMRGYSGFWRALKPRLIRNITFDSLNMLLFALTKEYLDKIK